MLKELKAWMKAQFEDCVETVGGISSPSKMPCHSYSIPAQACKIGSALAKVKGSVCEGCYALKGMYRFPNVKNALARRLEALDKPEWVEAMAFIINHLNNPHFRWHDSGDVQSIEHLRKIARVCELSPEVTHWLPTREHAIVRQYLEQYGAFPANLTVRLSALMIDGKLPEISNLPVSAVHDKKPVAEGASVCPAYTQDAKCLDCRACWNPEIKCISYPKH